MAGQSRAGVVNSKKRTGLKKTFNLAFCMTVLLTVAAVLQACGKGGPGDLKPIDAAVWFDAALDDAGIDGGSDAVSADGDVGGVGTISAEELRYEQIPFVMGQTYVDLRAGEDYARSHIPKARSLPVEQLWDGSGLVDGGSALSMIAPVTDLPLFFYSGAAETDLVSEVAEAVLAMGYTDVYVLEGGIESWREHGFYEDINIAGVHAFHYDPIPEGHYIVDAMPQEDYIDLHITGALNVDAEQVYVDGELIDGGQVLLDAVPCSAEVVIFYCVNIGCAASGALSEAVEQLSCYDETRILHYPEGLEGWQNAGYPLSCGLEPDGPCP